MFFLLINTNLPYTLSTTTNIIIISSSSKKQLSQSSSSSQLVASTGKRSRSSAGPKVVTAGISESILQSDIEGDEEENVVTQTSKRCKQDGRKPVDRSRSRALAATANGAACSSSVGNSGFYWDETAPTAEDAEQHARYSIYQIKVGHIFTTGLWCWPLLFYFLACPNSNSYLSLKPIRSDKDLSLRRQFEIFQRQISEEFQPHISEVFQRRFEDFKMSIFNTLNMEN